MLESNFSPLEARVPLYQTKYSTVFMYECLCIAKYTRKKHMSGTLYDNQTTLVVSLTATNNVHIMHDKIIPLFWKIGSIAGFDCVL